MKKKPALNPRKIFWKKGACSHAMFHLLNHEFETSLPDAERAADLLAGGIAQKGYQCGMLWGAALAAGAESYKRYGPGSTGTRAAIEVAGKLMHSFTKRTHQVNCSEISRVDWENRWQLAIYMLKTVLQGFIYSPCFNLMVKWTPEAAMAMRTGFDQAEAKDSPCISCASELVRRSGGTEEEAMMVAGFAGGIGLSGNACGALGAALWYRMLRWTSLNTGKTPDMFSNPEGRMLLRAFYIQTDSEVMCSKICGRVFQDAESHTEYISGGGCAEILAALQEAISRPF